MSQGPGYPQQDDPQTVPHVEQRTFEERTVPQVPRNTQYGPQWQPAHGYPRRRNRMPWVVFGGGLFVVGMIFTLVFTLSSGPDTDTPEGVAEAVADAFDDHDFEELTTLSCADDKEDVAETVDVLNGYGSQFGVTAKVDDVDTEGNRAYAELTLTYTKVPNELSGAFDVGDTQDVTLGLTAENGEWCLASFGG